MNQNKIKAALYASALGDSLGALTEFMTFNQIKALCNNQLEGYVENDRFLNMGGILGTVTDDFGSSYYVMKNIIKAQGKFNKEVAIEAVLEWAEDAYYFKFAGPTTKKAIDSVRNKVPKDEEPGVKTNFLNQGTNGAAMKVVPVAVLAKGDVDKAIQYAIDLAYPTHYNAAAVAGAASIAASIAKAQIQDTTLEEIFDAGIYGAQKATDYMESIGRGSIGPNVAYRIKEAIRLGKACSSYEELLETVDQKIGTNMETWESIAAVYAIVAGVQENCMLAIKVAVNAGGDTDSMAALAGAILASKNGLECLPNEWIEFMIKNNSSINVREVVDEFTKLVERG